MKSQSRIASFFDGMAHTLDIGRKFPSKSRRIVGRAVSFEADKASLRKTWQAVGSDIKKVLDSEQSKNG